MKRILKALIVAALVITNGIMCSCSREEKSHTLQTDESEFSNSNVSQNENAAENYLTEPESFQSTVGSAKGKNGNHPKSINYKVYNTETVFVVELTYNLLPYEAYETSSIRITVNGQVMHQDILNHNIAICTFSLSDLKPGWKTGDQIEWSFTETGNTNNPISYNDFFSLTEI